MKKIFLLVAVFLYVSTLQASVESQIEEHFYAKFEKIRLVIKHKSKDEQKSHEELKKLIIPIFDFELMAKLSLGKTQWKKMSKDERIKFIESYKKRMRNSYSAKLKSFDDEKLKIQSVVKKKNRVVVSTTIHSKDKILDIVYKLHKPKKSKIGKEEWLIYDVVVIGISILKADKAQFKDFLQTKSINELMDVLVKQ